MGVRIMQVRNNAQLNQPAFAKILDIKRGAPTISNWENGLSCPDVTLLSKISGLFYVNLHWLLTGEGNIHTPPAVAQTYPPELSDYLEKTIKVLQSESDYAKALGQNIDAFYKSVTAEETKNNTIDARLSNLENKIDNLLHAKDDAGTG